MKTIVVANQKGGVGKSTLSCNLAVAASQQGKSVLIVDADPQASSLQWRGLRKTDDISVVGIPRNTIYKEVEKFTNFDLIIIDAGGRDSSLFRSALMTAKHGLLLIPVLASGADIWATEQTFDILNEARAYNIEIPACVCFNQLKSNASLIPQAKEALADVTNGNDIDITLCSIGDREDFKKAFILGQGVLETSPKGKAANEISELYKEILHRLGEC